MLKRKTPWNDQVLVGTTEVADNGDPARATPSPQEIEYLVRSVAGMFPKAKISAQDIKYAFAGIRPLPNSPGDKPSAVTRRHFIHDHSDEGATRLLSIVGGKLTTAASLAREVARKIGITVQEPKAVTVGPGSALDPVLDQEVIEIARAGSVSEETARGMFLRLYRLLKNRFAASILLAHRLGCGFHISKGLRLHRRSVRYDRTRLRINLENCTAARTRHFEISWFLGHSGE